MEEQVVLHEQLSTEELDAFETALTSQFAAAKVFAPTAQLWHPKGMEVWIYLNDAAREAGIKEKIDDFGYMSRMRIMTERVDHEVGDWLDYGKGNWENIWTQPNAA